MRLWTKTTALRPSARPQPVPGPRRQAVGPPTRAAATAGSSGSSGSSSNAAPPESIRDFIAREAPLRAIDGSFRERPLAPTLEAPFLIASELPPAPDGDSEAAADRRLAATAATSAPSALPPCPGAVSLHRLGQNEIDAVLSSGGQIILLVAEEGSSGAAAPRVAAPRSRRGGGAYCVAGRVAGLLGSTARVVGQQRVAVQALDAGRGLAQAAALPDRWAYMVRSSAVEAAVTGVTSDTSTGDAAAAAAAVPREVATAAAQVADAAREVAAALSEAAALAARIAETDASSEAAAREAEAEVSAVLDWACGSSDGELPVSPTWEEIEKLSWAPFAASALAALSGGQAAVAKLGTQRLRALETTDLGARLEDGLEVATRTRAALAAALAMRR